MTLVDGKFDAKAQAAALENSATSKKFDAVAVLPVDGQSACSPSSSRRATRVSR